MKKEITHWLNQRLAVIRGYHNNNDDLTSLSVTEMLYLYCEIVHEFGVLISPKSIEDNVFSSLSKLVENIEELIQQ